MSSDYFDCPYCGKASIHNSLYKDHENAICNSKVTIVDNSQEPKVITRLIAPQKQTYELRSMKEKTGKRKRNDRRHKEGSSFSKNLFKRK
jgi:hypothetical protein